MKKIRNILLLSFSLFFVLLAVVLGLNQYLSYHASKTNKVIATEITPALTSIKTIHALNREGMLLLIDRWTDKNNINTHNRVKQILEVEMPHALNQLRNLRVNSAYKTKLIRKLDTIMSKIEIRVHRMNAILMITHDENAILNSTELKSLVRTEIPLLSFELNNTSTELESLYTKDLALLQSRLEKILSNASNFVLMAIIIGSVFGVILVLLVTRTIVSPIQRLIQATESMQPGESVEKLDIEKPEELAELSKSFNRMSNNLAYSYNEIQKKNEELEQFVYITSHDLQEPLKTLNTLTERLQLKAKNDLDPTSKKFLEYINTSTHRMSAMVNGLMEHSKLGNQSEIGEVDLNKVVEDVKMDLSISIQETITQFQTEKLPIVKGYPVELHLLFQNIISNAIKFRSKNRIPNISISCTENDNYYIISITDNGIGLNPKYKDKVFAMFQRLHGQDEYKGTGIGLAHCKKIVDLHRGTIDINGEIDQGTTVSFCISKYL
ncbi:His Kinase A (phospho-acceptor) domain-containing protein [Lishizhenia tianjinensis]|uniref:histidine kinase n=1 Tax=Lishizhenia tianjinensis TaxID=477690 RepID=A0A1I6XF82_9FLAO|nr:ATP-binding protein [Lishizhenia tianjinensis]SFT36682.1 His Kinase A (phospho-acceptor) domain-containing protein [Lishizhenia tianjinensis]